ncbi:MAG: hypothetical protein ACXAEB_15860, partial [Candidatus Thorarchaeota archaeon]
MAAEATTHTTEDTSYDFDDEVTSADLDCLDEHVPDLDELVPIEEDHSDLDTPDTEDMTDYPDELTDQDDFFDSSDSVDSDNTFDDWIEDTESSALESTSSLDDDFESPFDDIDLDSDYNIENDILNDSSLSDLDIHDDYYDIESQVQTEEWAELEAIENHLEEELLEDLFHYESITNPLIEL